jgi:hypothetical protein
VASSPAQAAFPTRVLTAAEPDAPLPELRLSVAFDQRSKSGQITREWLDEGSRSALDVRELDYEESWSTLTVEARVGLYRDLELTVAAPIVLAYESSIGFAEGVEGGSTVYAPAAPGAPTNADDPSFALRFPITEVPASRNRGGFGDMRFGLGWSPVVDGKDPAWPTITLRGEVTAPTGEVWAPADVAALPSGPGGAIGRGQTVIDVSLGLSKRARPGAPTLDPYVIFGGRLPFAVGGQQARGMEPAPSARVRAGTELVVHEDREEDVRYAVDLGMALRYTASGRTYSPLSDYLPNFDQTRTDGDGVTYDDFADPSSYASSGPASVSCSGARLDRETGAPVPATPGVPCGELNRVDEHVELGGQLAVHLQPTRYTLFRFGGRLAYVTDHLLTHEPVGEDTDPADTSATCGAGPCAGRVNASNARGEDERSPYYDPRYDAPGRRFRIEETFVWSLFVEAGATF